MSREIPEQIPNLDYAGAGRPRSSKSRTEREAEWKRRYRKRLKGRAKREKRQAKLVALAAKTRLASAALGSGQLYEVIYADPPWRWEPRSDETGMDRAADNHYPTMTLDDIKALAVPAAKNCVLFLWATQPMLPQALEVMAAWGFEYRSHTIWRKHKAATGYWFRNRHELLLLGMRGYVPAPVMGDQYESVIDAVATEHSVKPFVFHEIIEEMFPALSRIELFARQPYAGWATWGNELDDAA